jgi:hypothetical protein
MTLKDLMTADVAAVFLNSEEMSETGSYNGQPITIIVEWGETPVKGNYLTSTGQTGRATLWVAETDIPSPKAGIQIMDAFGIVWRMEKVISSGGGIHALACIRSDTASAFGVK